MVEPAQRRFQHKCLREPGLYLCKKTNGAAAIVAGPQFPGKRPASNKSHHCNKATTQVSMVAFCEGSMCDGCIQLRGRKVFACYGEASSRARVRREHYLCKNTATMIYLPR
jgi:hypothetical protein